MVARRSAQASDPTAVVSGDPAHTLSLRNITKAYGEVIASNDVSLDVPRGEFLTLLGPSGSGKTTLLMIIAGFIEPTAGELYLNDRPVTHLPPEKRSFGMVFQGYALLTLPALPARFARAGDTQIPSPKRDEQIERQKAAASEDLA